MTDHDETQAALIDAYLNTLIQDIHAPPPPGLDALTADLLRDLVGSQHLTMDDALMRRVWLRALVDARIKQQVSPSQNGNLSHLMRQESLMQTPTYPTLPSTQPKTQVNRTHIPLRMAIAAVFTLLFVGILLMMNTTPDSTPFNMGSGTGISQQQTDNENIDIEALLERYINELIVAGVTSNADTILSPEHTLDTNIFQFAGELDYSETLIMLVSLSRMIESITIKDIISDANSVWARVEVEQSVVTEGESSSIFGIIVAYIDNDMGLFDTSYIMLFDMLIPTILADIDSEFYEQNIDRMERNTLVALDVFWGEDAAALDVNWARLADSYTADYQLHVEQGGERTTFAATDDLSVARLLEVTRVNIAFSHPNIGLDVTEIYAFGSFVYVDAILNMQAPNEERSADLSIVYRLEDGAIAEEWWTTAQEIFAIESTDE